jgi:hypothetical protein
MNGSRRDRRKGASAEELRDRLEQARREWETQQEWEDRVREIREAHHDAQAQIARKKDRTKSS